MSEEIFYPRNVEIRNFATVYNSPNRGELFCRTPCRKLIQEFAPRMVQNGTSHLEGGDKIPQRPVLKNDSYRRARGGNARFITLYCSCCRSWLMLYQKDGDGKLMRCYLNRIFAPPDLESLQHNPDIANPADLSLLRCKSCNSIIGYPMRHEDGRLAFRLSLGSVAKKNGVRQP